MKLTPLKVVGAGLVALSGVAIWKLYSAGKEVGEGIELSGLNDDQSRRVRIMKMLINKPYEAGVPKVEQMPSDGMSHASRAAWNRNIMANHPRSMHLTR